MGGVDSLEILVGTNESACFDAGDVIRQICMTRATIDDLIFGGE